jgi:Protein of unknown function (DUF551)
VFRMTREWKKVEDGLPPVVHPVLIYQQRPNGEGSVRIATLKLSDVWDWQGKGSTSIGNVTHWMPLPETPPQVERLKALVAEHTQAMAHADKIRADQLRDEIAKFPDGLMEMSQADFLVFQLGELEQGYEREGA